MVLIISEHCAVKYADVIVADNIIIQRYIKTNHNKESTLIKYGGDQSVQIKPLEGNIIKHPFINT